MLAQPKDSDGVAALGNIVDYSCGKTTPSTVSPYDAELHACADAGDMCEHAQATMAELHSYVK